MPKETIQLFATRLRWASKYFNYDEGTNNQIRDEILCKCSSAYIKWKLLEEVQGHQVDKKCALMTQEGKGEASASVNRIEGTKRGSDKKN